MVCNHEDYEVKYVQVDDAHKHELRCSNCKTVLFDGQTIPCFDGNKDGICENCGGAYSCFGGVATCTEQAVCELCGKSYGATPKGEHDWSNKTGVCAACPVECEHPEWKSGACAVCGTACDHKDLTLNVELAIASFYDEVIGGKFHDIRTCTCGEKTQRYGVLPSQPVRTGNACVGQTVTLTAINYPEITVTYTDKPTCNHNWVDGKCTLKDCQMVCKHGDYDIAYVASTTTPHAHVLVCANCEFPLYGDTAILCKNWDDNYDKVCDKCGNEYSCTGGEATCTEKVICELCGEEYGKTPAGHAWANWKGICDVCGEQHAHDACGTGTCSVCDHYMIYDHPDFYKKADGTLGADGHCDACGMCLDGLNSEWLEKDHNDTHHWYVHITCGEKFNEDPLC